MRRGLTAAAVAALLLASGSSATPNATLTVSGDTASLSGVPCGTDIAVTLTDSSGTQTLSDRTKACPPSADFSYAPTAPVIGETVSFSCITDTGVTCRWDRTLDQVPEAELPADQPFQYAYTSAGTKTTCVQAVNADGVASAWVCHQLTVVSGTQPPPPAAVLFNGDFETGDFSQWQHVSDPDPSSPHSPMVVSSPVTQGAYSAKLAVDPTDTFITGSGATSTRLDLFENSNTAWASEGKDVWEHAYVMFPTVVNSDAPYKPTAGDWNWNFQWHSASSIIGGESTTGGQPFAGTVQTGVSFTDSGCGYNSSGNYANQELAGYFTGGDIASGPQPKRRWCLNKPLQYDHWYDVYLHVVWSKSASVGLFHLEIDGQVIADLHQASLLYNSATGAVDVPNLELSNYRGPDPSTGKPPTWSSTIYYDGVMLGPTKSSVQ